MTTAMKYGTLGNSGLKASRIVYGCMSFGSKDWAPWVVDDEQTVFKLLKYAYDRGIRTWDTANVYSHGESERMIGRFLKQYNINRSTVTLCSKVYAPVKDDPSLDEDNGMDGVNRHGLSRKHILDSVDSSVERLGTYIDLLQIHRLDHDTPKAEIMDALHDVVKAGKVRYLGASSMRAVDFAQLQHIADRNNWTRFISMQNLHNLVYREEEREMIPYCQDTGVALMPWSPLAMGILARPRAHLDDTTRGRGMSWIKKLAESDCNKTIIDRVEELANRKNVKMAQIATAWSLAKGEFPIVGLSSEKRIDEALGALDIELTDDELDYLEQPYEPQQVLGYSAPEPKKRA